MEIAAELTGGELYIYDLELRQIAEFIFGNSKVELTRSILETVARDLIGVSMVINASKLMWVAENIEDSNVQVFSSEF